MEDTALAPLLAFLNTHDWDITADWFDPPDPAAFRTWAAERAPDGLVDAMPETARALDARLRSFVGDAARIRPADVALARDVRDGLLALLLDGDAADPSELDRLAAELPLRLGVAADGRVVLEPAGDGALAIAALALLVAHDAAIDGTWDRIRLCSGDNCHWAFVDRSKNRSRRWCSMADCGARAKARAYRARRRNEPA